MNFLHDIPHKVENSAVEEVNAENIPLYNAVVEISNGDNIKYEVHPCGEYLTAVRALSPLFRYPFSYGYIPRTLEEDGDALDAIILTTEPLARLSVVEIRVLGYISTIDCGKLDNKIVGIPVYLDYQDISMDTVVDFLKNYKFPKNYNTTVGKYVADSAEAEDIIFKAHRRYIRSIETSVPVLDAVPDIVLDEVAPVIPVGIGETQESEKVLEEPQVVETLEDSDEKQDIPAFVSDEQQENKPNDLMWLT